MKEVPGKWKRSLEVESERGLQKAKVRLVSRKWKWKSFKWKWKKPHHILTNLQAALPVSQLWNKFEKGKVKPKKGKGKPKKVKVKKDYEKVKVATSYLNQPASSFASLATLKWLRERDQESESEKCSLKVKLKRVFKIDSESEWGHIISQLTCKQLCRSRSSQMHLSQKCHRLSGGEP